MSGFDQIREKDDDSLTDFNTAVGEAKEEYEEEKPNCCTEEPCCVCCHTKPCCKNTYSFFYDWLGCHSVYKQPLEVLSQEEIDDAITKNMSLMTSDQQEAVRQYAALRENYNNPFHDSFEQHLAEDEGDFANVFGVDLVKSRAWTNRWWSDLWYFALQQHPLLGFWAHSEHPLDITDRVLVVFTGFCMCLINNSIRVCDENLCFNDCYHHFLNNGVCDDGGENGTWLGIAAGFPCDYGYDCNDCDPRSELVFADWASGPDNDAGIWCFDPTQKFVWSLFWAICVALAMLIVKNLIMCPCCLTEGRRNKRCWLDVGQAIGTLMVLGLSAFAGWISGTFEIDGWALLEIKLMAYVYAFFGTLFVFLLTYRAEKRKIWKFGGIRNYILANKTLAGYDQTEKGKAALAKKRAIASTISSGLHSAAHKLHLDSAAETISHETSAVVDKVALALHQQAESATMEAQKSMSPRESAPPAEASEAAADATESPDATQTTAAKEADVTTTAAKEADVTTTAAKEADAAVEPAM